MHKTHISATELKNRVSEVLNEAYYKGRVTVIERHGKPIAKISPVKGKIETTESIKNALHATFGSLPDFPDVTKFRRSRKRSIHL
ncbi:MAG: type II toxin-antitoxin system prevent-host-death family antitoxin [Candidatus Levybacteria bacterium]|nr:type II toxin-antitoxin system prevent-host-death family antitoxin [Candidatus Levybacteria bacterium]